MEGQIGRVLQKSDRAIKVETEPARDRVGTALAVHHYGRYMGSVRFEFKLTLVHSEMYLWLFVRRWSSALSENMLSNAICRPLYEKLIGLVKKNLNISKMGYFSLGINNYLSKSTDVDKIWKLFEFSIFFKIRFFKSSGNAGHLASIYIFVCIFVYMSAIAG